MFVKAKRHCTIKVAGDRRIGRVHRRREYFMGLEYVNLLVKTLDQFFRQSKLKLSVVRGAWRGGIWGRMVNDERQWPRVDRDSGWGRPTLEPRQTRKLM